MNARHAAPARSVDRPEPGFFTLRLVKGGPKVPARIVHVQPAARQRLDLPGHRVGSVPHAHVEHRRPDAVGEEPFELALGERQRDRLPGRVDVQRVVPHAERLELVARRQPSVRAAGCVELKL